MTEVIIDTNVAVIANRQNADVVESCADACIHFLISAQSGRVILIDDSDEVRKEYAKALRVERPYQLGAQFLLHVLQQQFNPQRVRRVVLAKDDGGEFADFPNDPALAAFDRSDRKFAALAKQTGVAVTNATDSDWADFQIPLNSNGIAVEFLCGCDKQAWFL